jgi:hypothetical protein
MVELDTLAEALATAHRDAAPRLVTIEGPCGSGKSTLLERFLASVRSSASISAVRARRLDRLTRGALAGTLRAPSEIIAIDDAQWMDRVSLQLIEERLARGGAQLLVLAFDDALAAPLPVHERIELSENDAFDRAITQALNAPGLPAERAIARFLGSLPPAARTTAQMLGLIAAPVEARLAHALWPDRRDFDAALDALAPLLAPDRNAPAFAHALITAAVVETIPMKIPLHRRIVAAIERAGVTTLPEQVLLVEQLLGSGDRARAQEAAIELAFAASRIAASDAQLWASARHVELGEPADERFVPFYGQYFAALMDAREYELAEEVASHALSQAQRRHVEGVVVLAAALIEAQWTVNRRDAARASYQRYEQAFSDPADRAQLRAAAPWLRAS